MRPVRWGLHPPPRSPMRTDVSRSLRDSPQFAGVSAGSNADTRSLPLAEVAMASILAAGLWALQTRSWRATELHMKTARFKSTSRASRIGGTTRQEHLSFSETTSLQSAGRFFAFFSGPEMPFPGTGDRERQRHGSNAGYAEGSPSIWW